MIKKFDRKGTFNAYHDACKWLDDNGYSYGPTCAMKPVAIYKGDFNVAKWKNLSQKDINEIDGKMMGEMREGPVHIHIYDK